MKKFRQYLEESAKEHHYALKLAIRPTDEQLDSIETYLKKFDLIEFGNPVKLEKEKIDFPGTSDRDVYQMHIVLGIGISPYHLMQQIKSTLNIPEDFIVIRSSNEPVQVHAEEQERDGPAYDLDGIDNKLSAARLSTDPHYDDGEQPLVTDIFGDGYNKKLLDYLRSVADDRKTDHYEAPAPLFSWIDMDKASAADAVAADDFNAGHDTPKPVYTKGKNEEPVDKVFLGRSGNFDDAAALSTRFMKDDKGKRSILSGPRAQLKSEKK
jgi:hypothetical protein